MRYASSLSKLQEPWKSFSLNKIFAAHFEGYPEEYVLVKRIIEENLKDPTIDLAVNPVIISPYLWEVLSGKTREDIKDINKPNINISEGSYKRFLLFNDTKENINIALINHKTYILALEHNSITYNHSKEQFAATIERRIAGLKLMIESLTAGNWPNLMIVTPQIGEETRDVDASYSINPRWETSVLVNKSKSKNSGTIFYFPTENPQSKKRFIQRWIEVKSVYAKARNDWPHGLSSAADIPLFKEDVLDFNINSLTILNNLLLKLKSKVLGEIVTKPKLFISYSHKDEEFKDKLEEHLSGLLTSNRIDTWNDRKILPGERWDESIKRALHDSDIILLLVSSTFMSSGYIKDVEIVKAIEKHRAGEALIIPIVIRPCDFSSLRTITKFQALPKNAKPVTKWEDYDEAFLDVVKGLKRVIENIYNLIPNMKSR